MTTSSARDALITERVRSSRGRGKATVRHIIDLSSFAHIAAGAGPPANLRNIAGVSRAHERCVDHVEAREPQAAALWSKQLTEAENYMLSGSNPQKVLDLLS